MGFVDCHCRAGGRNNLSRQCLWRISRVAGRWNNKHFGLRNLFLANQPCSALGCHLSGNLLGLDWNRLGTLLYVGRPPAVDLRVDPVPPHLRRRSRLSLSSRRPLIRIVVAATVAVILLGIVGWVLFYGGDTEVL